jgi:SAM-dependent methyltransferase
MSGFSPEWLALREPADHRSRAADLEAELAAHFARSEVVSITDIGCGTGSNLRATFSLLGPEQHWTLVDHDAGLLAEARARLVRWADLVTADDESLNLRKAGRRLAVRFRKSDLARDLEAALGPPADLVTASALFDLASADVIDAVARAVAARRAAFYTVLTYNGIQRWRPAHSADAEMVAAFHAHQATDKGLGAAAGPNAPRLLREAFRAVRYRVSEGDSPWLLDARDQSLVSSLSEGFAGAVRETSEVPARTVDDWAAVTRTGAEVGHTDMLAFPP